MIATVLGALSSGFLQTLKLFAITLIGSLPLGLIISFGSMSRWAPFARLGNRLEASGRDDKFTHFCEWFKPISLLVKVVVWVVRGTPLMLQLIIIFYIPGQLLPGGSPWPAGDNGRFIAAAVAFIFNYACYFSEIFRGGIQGVPVGQQEAGQVLGMTKRQIFFKVTLLQMIKRIVPPMSNEIITLVKDTSIARIISFQEIIWAGYSFLKGSHGYSGLIWPLFFTGVYYLVFNGLLTLLFGWVERRLSYFR
ncbi:MAG: amino acid ABC transporter permease [Oscillospiraceae bacterium]|nr:amino acid ABC transporter permease [Oscillospiraceae bacterium]